MVYEYKLMVYEYPFTDKFGCCSLYDSIERARWRPRQTENKYFTQLSNLSLLTINCE